MAVLVRKMWYLVSQLDTAFIILTGYTTSIPAAHRSTVGHDEHLAQW